MNNSELGVTYSTHVQDRGWLDYVLEDGIGGTTGQSRRLEALKVKLVNCASAATIKYRVSVPGKSGWQPWSTNDQVSGTVGEAQMVEAVEILLENAPGYSVVYRAHLEGIGWTDQVKDGTTAGTIGDSRRLEAIQIHIVNNDTGEKPVDQYINGLKYDADRVLVNNSEVADYKKEDGQNEPDGTFVVIKKKERTVSNSNADLVYIDALAARLYPGAMLLANSKLIENAPEMVSVDTKPVGFMIDLPKIDGRFTVDKLSIGAVDAGIKTKLKAWKAENPNGNIVAKIKQNVYEVKNQHQIEASLGFKFSSASQNLNINFSSVEEGRSRDWVLQFQQIYYNVILDDFKNASDIIADSVTPDELKKKNVNDKNPLGIIKNVSYGRIVYVHFKTENTSLDIGGDINLILKGEKNLDTTARARYKQIKDSTSTDVFIYGGGTSAFSAMPQIGLDGIADFIAQGYNFDAKQEAAPIGYGVVFMKNGGQDLAVIKSTTSYIETTRDRYPAARLRLYQGGAFVNHYEITWNEIGYDSDGNVKVTPRHWDRNGKDTCVGQKFDLFFNGNVRNLRIYSRGKTGIVWDKWRVNFNQEVKIEPTMEFDVGGTTLNQKSWFHNQFTH